MIGVLAVDDDRELVELIQSYLSQEGFQVDVAVCGEEALAMYSPERHHVVLSDVHMPGMDGFEFLARLREADGAAPLVFMTGQPSDKGLMQSVRVKSDGYVEKPFDPCYLVALLRHAARVGKARRATARVRGTGEELLACAGPAATAAERPFSSSQGSR